MGEEPKFDYPDIPWFLKRDANNRAPFMSDVEQTVEVSEPKAKPAPKVSKANGKAPPKKAKAVKAAAPKKEKAKAVKAAAPKKEKAKAVKAKAPAKAEKDQFGLRKGSTKSQAAAMYARKSGATLEEVKSVVGSIQLNVLNELEENGFTVKKEKQERKGQRPVTRYWLIPKAK